MSTSLNFQKAYACDLSSETTWSKLYPSLRSIARRLVYSFRVLSWQGQEEDIVEDVVQETARRIIERSQQAERGEMTPIHSLEHMMIVIARNYCIDLSRRDHRLVRISANDYSSEAHTLRYSLVYLSEISIENVYQEVLFLLLALEIVNFPDKQRRALLMDLANRMHFDTLPTPLQEAFLKVGIQLQKYQQPLPDNPTECGKHASLLIHAYKRLAQHPCVQKYVSTV